MPSENIVWLFSELNEISNVVPQPLHMAHMSVYAYAIFCRR